MSCPPSPADAAWVQRYMLKAEWTLPEVLAWIVCRDPDTASAVLNYGRSGVLSDKASVVIAWSAMLAVDMGAEGFQPYDALDLALLAGDVVASGEYRTGGRWRPEPRDWQYLKFANPAVAGVRPGGPQIVIDERSYRRGDLSGVYVGVCFERETVVAAFPALAADRQSAWWPAPNAKKGHWARPNGPADAAAQERLRKAGAEAWNESDICGELAAMWNEARPNDTTTKASLVTMRSNAR